MPTETPLLKTPRGQIAVATTVMLTFISFWRAAAIVLNDMASSAYYVPGIAEQAVGRAAPWFILGVMLFSYAVRLVYLESTMMFVRGGLYRVVKSAMGGTLAKLSVAALMFDFILTGPISTVSAGIYVMGMVNQILLHFNLHILPADWGAQIIACCIIFYFWRQNILGMEESSSKAMRIMQITSVLVVLLLLWCFYTLLQINWNFPPTDLHLTPHALGWLKDFDFPQTMTAAIVVIGLGHSFLAMSGQETFAQVSREIAYPKLKNLKRAGLIIFFFCLIFTTSVAFFGNMIIPDSVRPQYYDNMLSGIVVHLIGPEPLKMVFQAFVVIVGFLILSGASNTALIGSNALMSRLSEDGVVADWFRKPHKRFGTSYRIIHCIAILQIITILLSRGNVYLLGEAYAFGVVWSFFFQTLAVTVLRYKDKSPREWKFPLNLHLGKLEIPIGLLTTLLILFSIAMANLFTKQVATLSGLAFTVILFIVFLTSEKWLKKRVATPIGLDRFQVEENPEISRATVGCKPHSILVPIIESKDLSHLNAVLETVSTKKQDVVVMTTRLLKGPTVGQGEEEIFSSQEQNLFTKAVNLAEKHGKTIRLVVAASNDTFFSIAQTAFKLDCESIVLRVSAKMAPMQQAKALSEAWDKLPNPNKKDVLVKIWRDGQYILLWRALPPLPEIPRETLRAINYLYRELNPEGTETISRAEIIEMSVERFLKEYQAGQFTWSKEKKKTEEGR
ncbi:MAG: APC family permease [Deltaproteobacteria bacterium]|nr:APC family permease [Deltaproteobacteria bacterium]